MIEADKMLHLRRYMLTVLRSDTKSRVVCSLHSTSSSSSARERGYIFRSLHHCYIPRANSRSNYTARNVRTFCTTIAQSSVDEVGQEVTSFCDDVENGQTWSADRLKEVIRLCDESKHQLQPSAAVLLLNCCGNPLSTEKLDERQHLTDQVWRLIKENSGALLTLEHYKTLLKVQAENGRSVNPKEFLATMNVEPDDDTYCLLLNTVVKTDNIKHLQSIMPMILAKNISLDENIFCPLMQIYLTRDNVTESLNVIKLARDAKLPVDKLYTELACHYAAQGNISKLVEILNDEPQSDVSLLKILKSLSVSGNGRHISAIMNFFTDSASIKSGVNNLITELVHINHIVDADAIIRCVALNEKIAKHTTSLIDNFLNQLIMLNIPAEDITRIASDFVKSEREPMMLNNVAEISLKLGREKLSFAIFEAMHQQGIEVRSHYYWPLLMSAQQKGEVKIYSLIKSMKAMDVEIDLETLTAYVLPYVNTANPIITLQRLKLCGIRNTILLNTSLLYFLLKKNRLEDVLYLFQYKNMDLDYKVLLKQLITNYFVKPRNENLIKVLTTFKPGLDYVSPFLVKLLASNKEKIDLNEFQTLLRTFQKHNAKFSTNDAMFFKSRVNDFTDSNDAKMKTQKIIDEMTNEKLESNPLTIIPRPRCMNARELTCYLVEQKSAGYNTRSVLNLLLKALCQEKNLEKAEEVIQEINRNNYSWTFRMKMDVFLLYVRYNKLKEAEELLHEMQPLSHWSQVDSKKILQFAIALVKMGKWKTAINIIENLSNKNPMNALCAQLLTAQAEGEYYQNTKDMLEFLVKNKYCYITTELLRPLVAIHLRQNDILSAVETLDIFAREYRKLPLAANVFTALLREKDNPSIENVDKYIEKVYNMIVSVNGVKKANSAVAIGLANLNKMDELRNLLQKQDICVDIIMNYFNYAQRLNDVSIFLRILEASPQDSKNVYQNMLCDSLLTYYSKISDCKSTLALWELMRTKNIEPNKSFQQGFVELFYWNKVPLPAEFKSNISEAQVSKQ